LTHKSDYLRQLVIECVIQRFSTNESLAYIQSKTGRAMKVDCYWYYRRELKKLGSKRLAEMMRSKDAYLQQYFERIDEVKKYQQELWRLYHIHPGNPFLQKSCINDLLQTTVVLSQLYDLMPTLAGLNLASNISQPYQDQESTVAAIRTETTETEDPNRVA
jgi:hypothetical protein